MGDDERTESEDNRQSVALNDFSGVPAISPGTSLLSGVRGSIPQAAHLSPLGEPQPVLSDSSSTKEQLTEDADTPPVLSMEPAARNMPPREPGYDADIDSAVPVSDSNVPDHPKRPNEGVASRSTSKNDIFEDAMSPPPAVGAPVQPQVREADTSATEVPTTSESILPTAQAVKFDLQPESNWWLVAGGVPSSLSVRTDVRYEIEETERWKRGVFKSVVRDIYVLFPDCSQTVLTVEFSAQGGNYVAFQQRLVPAPVRLRRDELELAYMRFGRSLGFGLQEYEGQSFPAGKFIHIILDENAPESLAPIGNSTFGALVYRHYGQTGQVEQAAAAIKPGDIATISNANGRSVQSGVVYERDAANGTVSVLEQEPALADSKQARVKTSTYSLNSGDVSVFRVVGREYVGW